MDNCFGSVLLKALNHGSDLGYRVRANDPLDCQKYSLDPNPGRFYELPAYSFFKELRCYLNDGFAIDQEFECLPVDGKMFVLGHNACSAKNRGANFVANRDPPCTR